MADFDIDNPVFEPDDWEENIGDDDVLSTSLHDDDGPSPSERVTIDGTSTSETLSLQQELLQTAVDDYYNAAAEAGLTPSLGRDPGKFELVDGQIRLKAYPNLNLVNKRSGRPLALSTLASRGGTKAIREDLGFADWSQTRKTLSANGERVLQQAVDSLPAGGENITASVVQEAIAGAEMATTALDEELTSEQTDALATIDDPPLDVQWVGQANRELRGLKLAMTRKQDELVNNLAKLSELDDEIPGIKDHIARERKKLTETEDEGLQQEIQKRITALERELADKELEREARLEAASIIKEELRGQLSRIRETMTRVLEGDKTLAERVRPLFREQGVTLVSILTAIGMAISTLVLALTGGGGGTVTPPSPPPAPSDKGGLREWVKKHLKSLGRLLARLAGKAAAALPGIIGSIVSWLLGTLGKAAGWLAEHVWALAVAAGGLLFLAAREFLVPHQPKRH